VVWVDWWNNGRFVESTDGAYVGGVTTPITPHVSGFIANVLITDNQHVQAGQLLLRMAGRDYRGNGQRRSYGGPVFAR
jgi:membrane fusion protein, multidrug efflux system